MGGEEYYGEMAEILPGQKEKLDIKDIKILNVLSENGRYPCSTIAKKVKLSREVTAYRLNRLLDKKVINGFITIVNPNALGYIKYDVYMRFQKIGEQKEKEIIQKLKTIKNIAWIATFAGNYDLAVSMYVKSISGFDEIFRQVRDICGEYLNEYIIANILHEGASPHNLFGEKVVVSEHKGKPDGSFKKEIDCAKNQRKEEIVKIDDKDRQILRILTRDARTSLVDIATKIGLSPNTINYRVKKLIEGGVITDFTSIPSYPLLGLEWNIVLVKFKNFSSADEKKFLYFIEEHPYIDYYCKAVGKWDYQISILAKDQMHLRKILMDLRDVFKDTLQEYEALRVFNQYKFIVLLGDEK